MRTVAVATAVLLFLLAPTWAGFIDAESLSKGKSNYVSHLFITAQKAYDEKHYDDARAALEAILKIHPTNRAATIFLHKIWDLQRPEFDPRDASRYL